MHTKEIKGEQISKLFILHLKACDAYNKYCHNLQEGPHDTTPMSQIDPIYYLRKDFLWNRTSEGFFFWGQVYQKWLKTLQTLIEKNYKVNNLNLKHFKVAKNIYNVYST